MRDKKQIFILIFLSLLMLSCKKESTVVDPPATVTPGKQTDVEWPSLAKSSWPMHHHNSQSNGRSSVVGPKNGVIASSMTIPGVVSARGFTAFAIGMDSTLYFGSSYEPGTKNQEAYLYAINYTNGITKWKRRLPYDTTLASATVVSWGPLVRSDGSIIIGCGVGNLYAVKPDGSLLWSYQAGWTLSDATPSIDHDGNLYFSCNDGYLYSVASNGTLRWKITTAGGFDKQGIGTSISPDGKTIYVTGTTKTIYAVSSSDTINWVYDKDYPLIVPPLIDSQGNIYFGILSTPDSIAGGIYSLNPDGSLRWRYGSKRFSAEPTMDKDGNIYGVLDNTSELLSLDYSGKKRWTYTLTGTSYSPVVSDADGMLYLMVNKSLLSFKSTGTLLWSLNLSGTMYASPAISAAGVMIVGTTGSPKTIYVVN